MKDATQNVSRFQVPSSRLGVLTSWRFNFPALSIGLVAANIALLTGCTVTSVRVDQNGREIPEPAAARNIDPHVPAWKWIDSGQFRYRVERRAIVPNAGLQLPVASPDGRYVAALTCDEVAMLDPDAAINGKTLDHTELAIYDVDQPQTPPIKVARNAAWPTWSADGKIGRASCRERV